MKLLLIISTLVFFAMIKLLSCSKINPDDKFSLTLKENTSNKLKLDGYFYFEERGLIRESYFFYNNGLILNGEGSPQGSDSMENLEAFFLRVIKNNSNQFKANKIYWGLYNINGNVIQFERYVVSDIGPRPAYLQSGIILNDSTFKITSSMRSNGSELEKIDKVFKFRHFFPKPDSTNNFIK